MTHHNDRLVTQRYPKMDGLYPSIGNGFISSNVGCVPGGLSDDFNIHIGGVFNNRPDRGNSIPHRVRKDLDFDPPHPCLLLGECLLICSGCAIDDVAC